MLVVPLDQGLVAPVRYEYAEECVSPPDQKILIVDDDPALRKALQTFFRRKGYASLLAKDGEEALELFAAYRPALVLADIMLPRVSGLEVIRQIKQHSPETAAILMTGNPERDAAISGLRAGAMDFLTKPFSYEDLDHSVQEALLKHQAQARRTRQSEQLKKMVHEKEEHLKQAERELMQSAKMCALGELTAGLTHEINQPLTALKLTCQDMLYATRENLMPKEELTKSIEEMVGHIDGVIEIIKHMRNFAHYSDGDEQQKIDINHILRDVLNLTHRQFRSQGIVVRMDLKPDVPGLVSNRVKLEQVFMNLLSNARDALADCPKANKWISIQSRIVGTSLSRQDLLISVQDNANGIPEAIRDKVFQPFFTTKKEGRGTGLGLSISKRIVESLGGQLSFESTTGEGTLFNVALPLDRDRLQQAA